MRHAWPAPTPAGTPYLSVVATARNDNHGGDLLPRMQTFVNALERQCERHRIASELIIVEWNPPDDAPRLSEALAWPDTPWCRTRVIEVPNHVHARFEHSAHLPIFQMIAKNVGIRRAQGEYVLATNVDILFPDQLFAEIRLRRLRRDRVYRVDRHDADVAPDPQAELDEMLDRCKRNVIRVCGRMGTLDRRTGAFYRIYENPRLPLTVRRFLHLRRAFAAYARQSAKRAARRAEFALIRSLVTVSRRLVIVAYAIAGFAAAVTKVAATLAVNASRVRPRHAIRVLERVRRGELQLPALSELARVRLRFRRPTRARRVRARRRTLLAMRVRLKWEALSAAYRELAAIWQAEKTRIPLHTNACGDFTLLSRDGWRRTLGYPELELFSMHIDSLFLYQAHYAGLRETKLRSPIYHIEHTHGFKPEPDEVETLNTRLGQAAIPQITHEQFIGWITDMYLTQGPLVFNDENWGLASETLSERIPRKVREEALA